MAGDKAKKLQQPSQSNFGWRSLAGLAGFGMVLGLAGFIAVEGFIPPAVVLGLICTAGLFLLGREGKPGLIVLLVGFLLSAGLVNAYAVFGLLNVQSPVEFVPLLIIDLSIISGLVATIAGLRKSPWAVSRPAKVLAIFSVVLVIAGAAGSVAARVALEQGELQPGDVSVTAQDFEFQPERLEAASGEVTVYFANSDKATHSFSVEKLKVDFFRPGGTVGRISFFAQPGTYAFHCEPHPDMEGTLVVK